MNKKSINIIGAFDRYNYGDLLFPIIIEKYITKYKPKITDEYELKYFGLIESDLSNIGGKKTKPLSNLYNEALVKDSMIIVSGGDVLPSRISNMDIDLSKNQITMLSKKVISKVIGKKKYDNISKLKFGIKRSFPWIPNKQDLNKDVKIAYNAVGGSTIDKLSESEVKYIINNLKEADYVSVRDNKSYKNISNENATVSPDSASIMSFFFKNEFLETLISEEIKQFVKSNKYFCIQSNLYSIKDNEKCLVDEIEKICKEENVEVVLLPIGIAANHDDNIALERLHKYFTIKFNHFKSINIYEIMYLIANSIFFAGTSLHGNITAMSYNIPHIGLNRQISKLDNYLKTWDLEEQGGCIDFNELYNTFKIVTNISKDKLENKSKEIIDEVMKNFEALFNCLEDSSNE